MKKEEMRTQTNKNLNQLKKILKIVLKSNKFYQEKYKKVGVTSAEQVKTWADFYSLPLISRQELEKNQRRHPPFGTNLTRPLSEYIYSISTSGTTTGEPFRQPFTPKDLERYVGKLAYTWKLLGVTEKDVFCALSDSPVFYPLEFASLKRIGARTVFPNRLGLPGLLNTFKPMGVTVVHAFPTILFQLIELAQEHKVSMKDSGVRLIIASGEPGGSNPEIKSFFEQTFGAKVVDVIGLTEAGTVAIECPSTDHYHILDDYLIPEVVDVKTGKQAMKGELVLTCLFKQDFPLIRYRTTDMVELRPSPCSCGHKSPYLKSGVLGRIGQINLRGFKLYPEEIERTIRKYSKVVEYRIVCSKKNGVDTIDIFVELPLEVTYDYVSLIKRSLESTLGFTPRVFPLFPKTLERFGFKKPRRFLDYRLKPGDPPISQRAIIFSKLYLQVLLVNKWKGKLSKLLTLLK